MGVLTDIVVADKTEAQAVAEAHSPTERWPGFTHKLLDSVTISTLASTIDTGRPQEAFERFLGEIDMTATANIEEGPWVSVLGDDLVRVLASLAEDPGRMDGVVAAWAQTDELAGWEAQDVREAAESLSRHAAEARSEHRSLLMWNCL